MARTFNHSQFPRKPTTGRPSSGVLVEGEYVTIKQIAARLGVSASIAGRRLRLAPAPVTWKALARPTDPNYEKE